MTDVLGIDSGGTKTFAARANRDGEVTFWYEGKGLDPTGAGDADAALRETLALCGSPEMATIGLPFHGEIDRISLQQIATSESVLGSGARVVNDVAVAHLGAFAGGHGVLILAGTGSMAWAVGPKGTHRIGGFGHLFGDEGSAYWIGRKALAAASFEIDGRRENTGFASALCAAIGIVPADLIAWTYGHEESRPAIASVALLVSSLASQGQSVASEILSSAGDTIGDLGVTARVAAGLSIESPWAQAGSVFNDPIVASATASKMKSAPTASRLSPVGGAVLDAARRNGWDITDQWIETLRTSLLSAQNHALKATMPRDAS